MQLNATMVAALLGGAGGGAAPAPDAVTALATFRRATAAGAEAKGVAQERRDPVTIRALDQFAKAVEKAPDIDKALSDPRITAVLLPALGLAGKEGQQALVKRVLLSDPADAKGLAAQLGGAWRAAAATLDLKRTGLAGLKDPATMKSLSEAYLSYQYRKGLDEQGAGVSDALYFREKAAGVTDVYTILGDPVMRRVVTGALGLPQGMVVQSVEAQARAVSARLDLDRLQNPGEVQKLVSRYLISRAGTGGGASPVSLFA
jgi:hypothetical protein